MEKPLLIPTNDYVFKRISGDEANTKVLISLLRAILQINIRSITLFPQEVPRKGPFFKNAALDIVAHLSNGTRIDVEMQVVFRKEYIDRILYYWAQLFTFQPLIGKRHYGLKKTISITILNDPDRFFPHAHSSYKLMECHGDPVHILTDKEEFHFIDIGRVEEIAKIKSNEKLIYWMKFFKSTTREEMKILAEQDACIGRAVGRLEIMSLDENEVLQAWARDKFLWDQEVRETTAEERGEKRGREEGREEGLLEAAKKLISSGMDKKTVCETLRIDESSLI
jgi:predicted transposase/invertase (TIGR01784 family)